MTQLDKALIIAFLAGASVDAIEKFTGVRRDHIESVLRDYFARGIEL